jgi:hypothetical protein
MEPEGSLPQTKELSTCPYPEPDQSYLIISLQNPSTHLRLHLPKGLFSSGSPTNNLHAFLFSPIHATCPTNLIIFEWIILITLGEEYTLRTSSVCSFIHLPVTRSSLVQIYSSTPCSQTPLVYVSSLSFAPKLNHRQNYILVYSMFKFLDSRRVDIYSSGLNGSKHYQNQISS